MYIDPRWILILVFSALAYGTLSPVIVARGLLFLSGAMMHSVLLAISVGIALSETVGLAPYVWAIPIAILPTYLIALLRRRGLREDMATAIMLSITVSLSVISVYLVLTKFRVSADLWSYVLGDPLLSTWEDVKYVSFLSSIVCVLTLSFYREFMYLAVDPEYSEVMGMRVWKYDVLLLTLLGVAVVALARSVGIVLEHVMVMLPGVIAFQISRGIWNALVISLVVSLISSIGGLVLSFFSNLAPSGLTGLIAALIFTVTLIGRRR